MSGAGAATLDAVDGRRRLRFTRPLPHPPERIWRAVTEPAELAAWFPAEIEGARQAGAPLTFRFPGVDPEMVPEIEGEVLVVDPPRLLVLRWEDDPLRFQIDPAPTGATLEFSVIFDEIGRAARDAAGWHVCLEVLEHHLAGSEPPWSAAERWAEVHPAYVARLGPEAATIGPPGAGA